MATMELEGSSGTAVNEIKSRRKRNRKALFKPKLKFGCLRSETDGKENFDMEVDYGGEQNNQTHLVVMVNGIIGSAQNWRFAAKQFLKMYPRDVIVHCSKCNSGMLTFDGVDIMGERLAEEIISIIKRHPNVQKISFIGHSLGGLVARYAIARLYGRDLMREKSTGDEFGDPCLQEKFKGKIAGLEPINFITIATPHVGSKGHKQVPVFCGLYIMEKVASRATPWLLGRSVKHLFLADSNNGKPPLLLQMVNDCEDLKFMSALQSFKRRVAYANASFDHLVGWSTSSLRRPNELPKRQNLSRDEKYPHIINVETAKIANPQEVPLENKVNGWKTIDLEEEMIRGLTRVSWERVDVNFSGSKQRFLAHSTIQVKSYCINSDGADVIQHMIDNFLL